MFIWRKQDLFWKSIKNALCDRSKWNMMMSVTEPTHHGIYRDNNEFIDRLF